jgi:23S rRNA (cytidine1920-2'-O)/16S rRNA (cytidine1409-2'-O)-methyltransferase
MGSNLSDSKLRLDRLLVARGMAPSRQRARAMIMAGKILVNNRPADKAGILVGPADRIELKGGDIPYVSRGGLKLEGALQALEMDVAGRICLDVGASTGGFTDCLLQHGAVRVYAVDVGYGQLAWKLRQDPRVVVIERTNIRYLPAEALNEAVDLATIDVSFISLKIVVPVVAAFLKPDGRILALIKPQFEVGRYHVGKGGVVRDESLHTQVIQDLSSFFSEKNLRCEKIVPSPILGPKGNREFFILLQPLQKSSN